MHTYIQLHVRKAHHVETWCVQANKRARVSVSEPHTNKHFREKQNEESQAHAKAKKRERENCSSVP